MTAATVISARMVNLLTSVGQMSVIMENLSAAGDITVIAKESVLEGVRRGDVEGGRDAVEGGGAREGDARSSFDAMVKFCV